ncbi:MAG TPA: DUF1003 domain-containing protein [Acidimicrobiales bacterium]|nr:DUF1003 domain-containing protein [Acidimicrobiales bacterium]
MPHSSIYEYVRHPRAAELREGRPVTTTDLRQPRSDGWIARVNSKVGLRVTLVVGTMWCAYLFSVIALVALPSALHQGLFYVVVWVSSSFLQLVLLPIIIVGQNIQAAAADRRAEETYKDAEAVLKEAEEIQKHLLAQDEVIASILTRLERATPPTA